MNLRKTLLAAAASAALLLTSALGAAEDPLTYIPADAEFIASINLRDVLQSDSFKHVWDNVIHGQQFQAQIDAFQVLTEVKIMEDIDRIVIGGRIEDEDSIAILVQGRLPIDKLIAFLQMSPEYTKEDLSGVTVHRWDPSDPKSATVLGDNSILLCGTKERLVECLNTAKAGKHTLDRFELPASVSASTAWAWVRPSESNPDAAELRRIFGVKSALGALNLKARNIDARLAVVSESQETTRLIESVARGAVSLVELQRQEPLVQDIARRAKVERNDTERLVSVSLNVEIEEVIETVEALQKL